MRKIIQGVGAALLGIFVVQLIVTCCLALDQKSVHCPPGSKREFGQYIGVVCVVPPLKEPTYNKVTAPQ